jgi:hypothetical protein
MDTTKGNGTRRPVKSKTALIAAANALLAALGEHDDLDLVKQVYLTWTHIGVVYVDGTSGPITTYRKFNDPITGYTPKSFAEVMEAMLQ